MKSLSEKQSKFAAKLLPEERLRLAKITEELNRRHPPEFIWTDRQKEAITALARLRQKTPIPKLLYGGAMGGGKSYFLCAYSVDACERIPGNRWYLCRHEAVTFKRTTLQTMLEEVQILNRPGWRHYISDQYFLNKNGSRIDYGGLGDVQDREKIKSMELGGAGVEEASEVDRLSVKLLMARVGRKSAARGHESILLTSNPEECWLIEDFIEDPGEGYGYVPALPSDNPHLAEEYIASLTEIYGDIPELLAAYLKGDWSAVGSSDQIFAFADVDAAMKRNIEPGLPVEYGVDVARFGDDETVIARRRGLKIDIVAVKRKQDTMKTADDVMAVSTPREVIKVDDVGLGGGVTDRLRQKGFRVMPIVANARPRDPVKFYDLKSEIIWHLREIVHNEPIDLPDDPEFKREILAMKYRIQNGRIRVESKEEIKKRLGHSPDRFDAVANTVAGGDQPAPPKTTSSKTARPVTAGLRKKTF